MKHVKNVSAKCGIASFSGIPERADAKSDFLTAVHNAWSDFVYQKKNELSL